jgi:hypothetical protein
MFNRLISFHKKIKAFMHDPHQYIFVAQIEAEVAGFLSLSIIPQISTRSEILHESRISAYMNHFEDRKLVRHC